MRSTCYLSALWRLQTLRPPNLRHIDLLRSARNAPAHLHVQVLRAGDAVVAAARRPERASGLMKLKQLHGDALQLVRLDVNDHASIKVRHAGMGPVYAYVACPCSCLPQRFVSACYGPSC